MLTSAKGSHRQHLVAFSRLHDASRAYKEHSAGGHNSLHCKIQPDVEQLILCALHYMNIALSSACCGVNWDVIRWLAIVTWVAGSLTKQWPHSKLCTWAAFTATLSHDFQSSINPNPMSNHLWQHYPKQTCPLWWDHWRSLAVPTLSLFRSCVVHWRHMTQVTCKQKPYVSTELMQMNTNINLISKHHWFDHLMYRPSNRRLSAKLVPTLLWIERCRAVSIYISKFAINVVDDILDSRVQNGIGKNVQKHKTSKTQLRK
jgi:hypothetical protein